MTQQTDPVWEILINALRLCEPAALADDTAIEDLPNMDSMAHVRLMSEIERAIGNSLDVDETLMLSSVGDIRDLLRSKGKYAG